MVVLSLGFVVDRAVAGISIRSRMTLSVVSDTIDVKLAATNTGDEPGRKVSARLHIFGRTVSANAVDRLDVSKTHTFSFHLPVPENRYGRFAFVGEVFFHDSQLNPFSALSAGTFLFRNRYPTLVNGRCPGLTFEKKGRFTLYVENTSPRPQKVTATLFLPHALTATATRKRFPVDAAGKARAVFEIAYRYDFGSAVYPFFCVIEYDEDGHHYASLVRSKARIVEPKNWFAKTRWYWLAGLLGIAAIWVGIFFVRTLRRILNEKEHSA